MEIGWDSSHDKYGHEWVQLVQGEVGEPRGCCHIIIYQYRDMATPHIYGEVHVIYGAVRSGQLKASE